MTVWSAWRFIAVLWLGMLGLAHAEQLQSPRLLVLGDSLSAAHGIPRQQGWVTLLQQRLDEDGYPYRVINASISGDTTNGGLARLPAALARFRPVVVVIELGGNDGLRGFSLTRTRDNLVRMVDVAHDAGANVLLLGVRLPANYGRAYGERFQQVYAEVSQLTGAPLVPFFLAGVAEYRETMQPDGIHPNAAGQPLMLDNVWPALRPLLADP
jgi:acyl-CoA thioesterase-1